MGPWPGAPVRAPGPVHFLHPMLQLTFLGTSAGVPTRRRNVTGLAVQTGPGKSWLLVDCGEATQHQILRSALSVHDLHTILITHAHGDHCYGLPGLLSSCAMHHRTEPLTLIAPQAVLDWVAATERCGDLCLPYPLHVHPVEPHDTVVSRHDLHITRHPLAHRVPSHAYRIEQIQHRTRLDGEALRRLGLPRGPLWKALQQGSEVEWQGQRIRPDAVCLHEERHLCAVVAGDNAMPTLLTEACAGAQLLVHESTYTEAVLQRVGPEYLHSCAADVARFAEDCGLPNLILTHFSPRFDGPPERLAPVRDEATAHYHGHLHLACDFDVLDLHDDGRLELVSRNGQPVSPARQLDR